MKCWECGAKATKTRVMNGTVFADYDTLANSSMTTLSKNKRCYCEECFDKHIRKIAQENEIYIRIKRDRKFETAMDKLEKVYIDLWKYREAIKAVEEYNEENPDKFDSAAEIIAAIILVHNHIRIKPQYKIDRYQVDFLLPDEHLVLEIDGAQHKTTRVKDTIRDDVIRYQLGGDWQIVRIPSANMYKDPTKLLDGIDAILDYRYNQSHKWKTK